MAEAEGKLWGEAWQSLPKATDQVEGTSLWPLPRLVIVSPNGLPIDRHVSEEHRQSQQRALYGFTFNATPRPEDAIAEDDESGPSMREDVLSRIGALETELQSLRALAQNQ